MRNEYRDMFEGLREAAAAIITATTALQKTADAALRASEEHDDLRETVNRLEHLIIEQGRDIRALRDRLNGGAS